MLALCIMLCNNGSNFQYKTAGVQTLYTYSTTVTQKRFIDTYYILFLSDNQ